MRRLKGLLAARYGGPRDSLAKAIIARRPRWRGMRRVPRARKGRIARSVWAVAARLASSDRA